tara:strand:- start:3234 stop:3671 length:438 start_codon:yes stop_codon:yes gene_type:complete
MSLSLSEITSLLEEYEKNLLNLEAVPVEFDRMWPAQFSKDPGIYVIYDNTEITYFGETGNIRKRMKDLRRTLNHSYRRSLGFYLFNEVATSSKKFSASIETQLNLYFEDQIKVATMPVAFGRLEFEEYLVEKYSDQLLNKKKKRK